MEIKIQLNPDELNDVEKEIIRKSLGIETDAQFRESVSRLCKTALLEYKSMLTEKGMPNRISDVKEDRLFLLIKYFFINRMPSETEVSSFFHLTIPQSKTLIRNMKSRYSTKLSQDIIRTTLKDAVRNAGMNPDTNKLEFVLDSDVFLEDLNQIISKKGPKLSPIKRKANSSAQCEISEDTYELIKTELGID